MKKTIFVGILLFAIACKPAANKSAEKFDGALYGDTIDAEGAISIADMKGKIGPGDLYTKVSGKIDEVCQAKGCWMNLSDDKGNIMKVTFKDYGFFVPKNSSGKTAIVEGLATYDTTTVDMLKHYAEDEGKSQVEIAAITSPQVELVFEAVGVIIK
jgi:hypothetical protein